MAKFILGRKIEMTQVFDEKGNVTPVTIVEAGPCVVTKILDKEKNGYTAIQIGFGAARKLNKPLIGQLKDIDAKPKFIREFKAERGEFKTGDKIKASIFAPGDKIQITGISKGKGFAGVIKRHHFSRGPETHGSDHHRAPGSIGSMFPQRVLRGKKMAGHMGNNRVTIKKSQIVDILPDKNLLLVKGAVPGRRHGLVMIRGINSKVKIQNAKL